MEVVVLGWFELVGVGLEVVGLVGVHAMICSIHLNLYKLSFPYLLSFKFTDPSIFH